MIAWAVQAAIGLTVAMLVVLLLRRPVAWLFGAQWAYALWVLPPLRLLFPAGLMPRAGVEALAVSAPAMEGLAFAPPAPPAAMPVEPGLLWGGWPGLIVALWIGGTVFYLAWHHASYSAFLLHVGPGEANGGPSDFGGIRLVESNAVDGPVAMGIGDRRIVVPADFRTRYSLAEQRLALEHELVHHRRLDLVWNLAGLVLLALNWFNPVAHFAFRAFRADQELSCDAAVARAAPTARGDYARALVKSASRSSLLTVAALNHAAFLKRRLKMMDRHRTGWLRTLGGSASLVVAGIAGLALGGAGEAQSPSAPLDGTAIGPSASDAGGAERRAAQADQSAERAEREVRLMSEDPGRKGEAARHAARGAEAEAAEMARMGDRIAAEVRANMPSEAELRALAEKAEERARLAGEDRHAAMAAARQAMDEARVQLASLDIEAIKAQAVAAARASLDDARVTEMFGPKERAELREALEQATREIEQMDLQAQVTAAREALDRGMEEFDDR